MKINKKDLRWFAYSIAQACTEFGVGAMVGCGTFKCLSPANKIVGEVAGIFCAVSSYYIVSDILDEYYDRIVFNRWIEHDRYEDFQKKCTMIDLEET